MYIVIENWGFLKESQILISLGHLLITFAKDVMMLYAGRVFADISQGLIHFHKQNIMIYEIGQKLAI